METTQNIPNPIKRKSTPLSQLKSFKEKKIHEDNETFSSNRQSIPQQDIIEQSHIIDNYVDNNDYESEPYQEVEINSQQDMTYEDKKNKVIQSFCTVSDIQIFLMVIIIVFLIQLIPTHKLIEKYIAIDKIPFGDAISKAILAGIVVFIVIKLVKY